MRPLLLFCLALALLTTTGSARAQDVPEVETIVFRVDYLSLQPEAYYEASQPYRGTLPPLGHQAVAELYYRIQPAADFGYTEVFSALTGQRVMRAETVWAGAGQFEFPAGGSTDFGEPGPPVVADTVAPVLRFGSTGEEALAAWDAVATTEPVRLLAAQGPVEVVVFDHYYSVGIGNPATAEWIVVAYTRPDAPRDLAVVEVGWPGPLVTAAHPFEPEIAVHNFGDETDGGALVLEVDGSAVHEESITLAAGESAEVTLPPLTLDGGATLTFRLVPAGAPADVYPENNAHALAVATTPLPLFRPVSSLRFGGEVPLDGFLLDYDGDGDLDVLTYRGSGTGNQPGLWEQRDDGAFVDVTAAAGLDLPRYPRHALADDLTGDGIPDLLLVYFEQPPVLLRGQDGGPFEDVTTEAGLADVTGEYDAEAADLDGDGDLDLVFQAEGREPLLLNDGSGHFAPLPLLNDAAKTQEVDAVDLDGDGDVDLVLANWFAPSAVFVNDGAAGFTRVPGPWPGGGNRTVLPFDYDGDGDADLLFTRTNGDLSVLLRNDGDLQFTPAGLSAFEVPSFHADAADFDGDGRLDVVLDALHTVTLLANEAGGFVDRTPLLIGLEETTEGISLGTSPHARFRDLDGDGDVDLYLRSVYFENQGAPGLGTTSAPEPEAARMRLTVFPNPVAGSATAVFRLSQETHVTLRLFDVLGRKVATLSDTRRPAGEVAVQVPLASLPNGVYFVRLEAGDRTETRPITVLR
jgi:hypothetical protein